MERILPAGETPAIEQDRPDGPGRLAAIVEDNWTSVYMLLFSMTGRTHDAEDLTQETFLRAFDRLDSFRPPARMRSWLLRIATNACLDLLRKRKRSKSVPLPDDLRGAAELPGFRLEIAEESQRLRAALGELSETARAVFLLRVQESLSFREIADLLGSTEQAVRWHMHHARTRLLQRMRAGV